MSFSEKVHTVSKSLVICDSRFESQIALAVKSRDLEHLAQGEDAMPGGIVVRDKLGEANCESIIAARQRGVNPCHEAFRCLLRKF